MNKDYILSEDGTVFVTFSNEMNISANCLGSKVKVRRINGNKCFSEYFVISQLTLTFPQLVSDILMIRNSHYEVSVLFHFSKMFVTASFCHR
jgi:hypothetical protein